MPTRFDPFDPAFLKDPYPVYAGLRAEGPVVRVRFGWGQLLRFGVRGVGAMARRGMLNPRTLLRFRRARAEHARKTPKPAHSPGLGSRLFVVTRHADVGQVLRSPELFSSEVMGGSQPQIMNPEGDIAPTSGALIAHDPPEHTRQRSIVNRGFTPRRIASLEPQIRKNAEELFTRFADRGHCDLMEEFANPLPVSVIADLLGLDPARRDDFKRWSTALIVGSTQLESDFASSTELFREFRSYMTEVIEERRKNPGDDLISTLIQGGEDEGILAPEQVISFATLMLAAGSETTTNLIGNTMLALFDSPRQLERVVSDPKLIPRVIEEALRFDSPIQLTARLATQDCEIAGERIRKGSLVAALIGSANRDETQFEDPDRFDIERPNTNTHLAFGYGNHFCIGASLARMEGAIALEMILGRLRGIELAGGPVPRHGSFLVRGPSSLPVRFAV